MTFNLDYIFVGAGVRNLLLAIAHASQGKKVMVLESTQEIGGAWQQIELFDLGSFDVGCHVLEVDKKVKDFFNDNLNLNLEPMRPQPQILFGKSYFPYDYKRNVFWLRSFLKQPLKTISGKFKEQSFRLFPETYFYPKNASASITHTLSRLLRKHNVILLKNRKVEKIELLGNNVKVETNAGAFTADKLCYSSNLQLGKLIINKSVFSLEEKEMSFHHVHLHLRSSAFKKFSYIRIYRNEFIHRISDMTSQSRKELPDNERVWCLALFKKEFDEADVERILNFLIQKSFVAEDVEICQYHSNLYTQSYISKAEMEEIERKSNSIIIGKSSTNLVYSIKNILPEISHIHVNQ